ncbi:hypothetical protein GCM10027586_18570 [Kineococcus gypseus]|uniref:hypothetical protein n=1 Tax=Kineococcus gypseus TaxID=1637102 RepID=UPI003D7C6528
MSHTLHESPARSLPEPEPALSTVPQTMPQPALAHDALSLSSHQQEAAHLQRCSAGTRAGASAVLDGAGRLWRRREDTLWESTDRVITTAQLLEDAYGPTQPAPASALTSTPTSASAARGVTPTGARVGTAHCF